MTKISDYTLHYIRLGDFRPSDVSLSAPVLGLDTEFTGSGLYSPAAELRLVQLATAMDAYVFDMRDDSQRAYVTTLLADPSRTFVAHGATNAEVPALALALGVDISRQVFDTLILALLLHPGESEDHGLKDLAPLLGQVGHDLIQAQEELNDVFTRIYKAAHGKAGVKKDVQEFGWTNVPSDNEVYLRYAGLDAICALRLKDVLMEQATALGILAPISFEQKLNGIAARMSLRGWKTDPDKISKILSTTGAANQQHKADYLALTGHVPGSHKKKRARLEELGVEFKVWNKPTKKKDGTFGDPTPKLGHEELRELYIEYPYEELRMLLDFSETLNATTFLGSLNKELDHAQRTHPRIRTLGAVTGRWTVSNPGVQTVSNRSGAREAFIPSSPQHVLLSADLGQIEPRVAFTLANETTMINLMKEGIDAYTGAATTMFGEGFSKQERGVTKRVILTGLFNGGIDVMWRQAKYADGLEVSKDALIKVRDQFRRSSPRLQRMNREIQRLTDIRLPSGRYGPQDPDRLYRAINTLVQGTARDALMQRVVDLSDAGFDDYLLMTFHDEVMLDLPRADLYSASWTVRDIMEQGFQGTPTPTDLEVYRSHWGEPPLTLTTEGLHRKDRDGNLLEHIKWEDWK